MTPKSLFSIILKIFGLFFFREIILIIPQLIASIWFLLEPEHTGDSLYHGYGIAGFALILLIIASYCFIIYQLLFKTNNILSKLKLDQGFDQKEFSFSISTAQVLNIALIIIGGVILIEEIPNLCRYMISLFQEEGRPGIVKSTYVYLTVSAVKIGLGFLSIGERKRIVELIDSRQAKSGTMKTD